VRGWAASLHGGGGTWWPARAPAVLQLRENKGAGEARRNREGRWPKVVLTVKGRRWRRFGAGADETLSG
jgi:hypothetical protein